MNKKVLIFACIMFFLILIGYLLYSNLEIYKFTEFTSPSHEVRINDYYVIERWLKETGHPVRFENSFYLSKLAQVEERVVVIHSSACRWDNADEYIVPWIEQGGYLVVSLDDYIFSSNNELLELLFEFGVDVEIKTDYRRSLYSDRNVFFSVDDDADVLTINDDDGFTRLVEIPLGNGALTVTGIFVFMHNDNLTEEINAALAWNLTGARAKGENTDVLFVMERNLPKNTLGKIIERGNLMPVVVSAMLLIILGFWMVIPVFGLVSVEKQKTSRPLRERFLAEIRFLKKYRVLDHYLNVYEKEQNTKRYSNKNKTSYNYNELINLYRRIFNGTTKF